MAGVAAASTAGLMLGPALWWRLAGGRARLGFGSATESAMGEPRTAVRWAGAALAAASAWALGHGLWLRLGLAAWCFG